MTTRGIRTRTPRRRKVWAHQTNLQSAGEQLSAGNVEIAVDLLDSFKTDRGVNNVEGVTVMRIVGKLFLGNAATATNSDFGFVPWGIAWVSDTIASQGAGHVSIPNPNEPGTREAQWIQRGVIGGQSVVGAAEVYAFLGQNGAMADLDITQMRKQPSVDSQLVLITENGFSANEDATLHWSLSTMLALP